MTKSVEKYLKHLNIYYTLNGVFFHDLELADSEVYLNAVGSDLGETMGNIIAESYKLAEKKNMICRFCIPAILVPVTVWQLAALIWTSA